MTHAKPAFEKWKIVSLDNACLVFHSRANILHDNLWVVRDGRTNITFIWWHKIHQFSIGVSSFELQYQDVGLDLQ